MPENPEFPDQDAARGADNGADDAPTSVPPPSVAPPGAAPAPLTGATAAPQQSKKSGKQRREERKRQQAEEKARRKAERERKRAEKASLKEAEREAEAATAEPPIPAAEPTVTEPIAEHVQPPEPAQEKEGIWGFLTKERGSRAKREQPAPQPPPPPAQPEPVAAALEPEPEAQAMPEPQQEKAGIWAFLTKERGSRGKRKHEPESEPVTEPEPELSPSFDERAIREAAEREALARLEQAEQAGPVEEVIVDAEVVPDPVPEPESPHLVEAPIPEPELPHDVPIPEPQREALLAELERAEEDLRTHQAQEEELSRELSETERRLSETQQRMAEALERATEKLREVENRAAEAEERAERAERLALVRADESERAERLRGMLDRIAQAERRASSAEVRAREAVEKISEPLPAIDTETIFSEGEQAGSPYSGPPTTPPEGPVSINSATSEDLIAVGLSTTQAGRLLAHRERAGGFGSLDELDEVPGFPPEFLSELKTRVRL